MEGNTIKTKWKRVTQENKKGMGSGANNKGKKDEGMKKYYGEGAKNHAT